MASSSATKTRGLSGVDPAWAWAPYAPSPDRPWTAGLAAHVLRRAGFGAAPSDWLKARDAGPGPTVDRLLNPPGQWSEDQQQFKEREIAAARSGGARAFTAWWLRRVAETSWPLGERLTLCWHDHFPLASDAVADAGVYQRHIQLLREHAPGAPAGLFAALLEDPAMFAGLGGSANRKSAPNLPFARVWLEHFSVGPEATQEPDVQALARVMTGCFVNGGRLRFVPREHDAAPQSLLGHANVRTRADLPAILAQHPATARRLAARVVRWFVSEEEPPGEALVAPLADAFRRGATLVEVVERVLRSNVFYSEHAVGRRVLSPVELALGLARAGEVLPPTPPLYDDLAELGQCLDRPPTAAGWPGGRDWISTWTLAGRARLCRSLVEGGGAYGGGLDPWGVAQRHGCTTAEAAAVFWMDLWLARPLPALAREGILAEARRGPADASGLRRVLGAMLSEPEAQLG